MNTKETPTPAEQREHFHKLLGQFHTAMLVTHVGDGQLRARPMAVAKVDEDWSVWFITSKHAGKIGEIANDTRVHLIYQNDRSAYLALSGQAELVLNRAKIAELWQEPFKVWFPGGQDDPAIELIKVVPEEGEFWDNQGTHKIKYLFSAAKALVTGKTPEFTEGEEHGTVRL